MDSRIGFSKINRLRMVVGVVAIFVMLYTACTVIVQETESVLVVRLGKPSRVLTASGLHFRLPWPIEEPVAIDMRARSFETQHTEMLSKDKKNLVLLSFVLWKVEDPLRFYQAIGGIEEADKKINGLVTNAKIGVLGKYELSALASTDPKTLKIDQIETELLESTQEIAKNEYGISIEHIGLSRLSLPKENIKAVFQQMRAERKKFAVQFRSEGDKEAGKIRSQTDLDVAEIEAQTTEEVAKIKGEAEAEAARIYSLAHSKDPDLYRFIRSLETMEQVIGARSSIILRTDAEPFTLLVEEK